MVVLNRGALFCIIDALGIPLVYDHLTGEVSGSGERELKLGNLAVPIRVRVVATRADNLKTIVLARCTGNIGLLFLADDEPAPRQISVHLVNVAKCDSFGEFLEVAKPASVEDIRNGLGKALVKSYRQLKDHAWVEL